MIYVPQKDMDGCLVAATAMVAGRSYDEIKAMCAKPYAKGHMFDLIARDVLADLGFAVMTRYRKIPRLDIYRDEWPCGPFAPAHIVQTRVAAGTHAVAMDEAGNVFDPWKRKRTSLTHPDYLEIDYVDGFFLAGRQ